MDTIKKKNKVKVLKVKKKKKKNSNRGQEETQWSHQKTYAARGRISELESRLIEIIQTIAIIL